MLRHWGMKVAPRALFEDLRRAAKGWSGDHATRLASSLAYYTLLSLAPLMVLAVSLAGLFLGKQAAHERIAQQVTTLVGEQAGRAIQDVVSHAQEPHKGVLGTVIGLLVLVMGASGVFGELQAAFDVIWHVEPRPGRGLKGLLRDRLTSFTMVLTVAFLLLVSLILTTGLALAGHRFTQALPGGAVLWGAINFLVSFAIVSGLFSLMFKAIPDVQLRFGDVWGGGVLTALLFTLGKLALGLYLGRSSVASPYGAAGSLIVLVVWVYYSAQILFFGAEFTKAHVKRTQGAISTTEQAVPSPR
jgi:membrane protein